MTTRSRSLTRLLSVELLLFIPGLALAGPNEGGTLILHANPSLVFTSTIQNYCGMSALDSCSAAVTSVAWDPGKKIVFHAIAAFPPGGSPRLKAISFGIDYDSTKFVIAARGTCADSEIPGIGWPAAGTGTSQYWTTGTQTGTLTECYWFAGYAYSEQEEDSASVALIPHPLQHGVFVDDAFPAAVDTIAGYGRLGFGCGGSAPLPDSGGQDFVSVILVMKEQAPIAQLNQELRAERTSRRERHERVVRALQSATASQNRLLAELRRARAAGTVRSYTSFWVANLVEVNATAEYVRKLLRRSDIVSIEPVVTPVLMNPDVTVGDDCQGADGLPGRGATCGLTAINADKVWKLGINGAGTLVANIDTGVDGNHPALASRWRGAQGHPASECWQGSGNFPHDDIAGEDSGHGTHTMGTMTGLGGPQDTIGVAWGASWIAASFQAGSTAAFQWLMDPDLNPATTDDVPDVVNCSFQLWGNSCVSNETSVVLDNLQAGGTAVIWAVGNCGGQNRGPNPIAYRANTLTSSFAVGNADTQTLCSYPSGMWPSSCHGPTECDVSPGFEIKPEVSAPGRDVCSSVPGGHYARGTGTSMAAPHVAGVIALMRQANPDIEVDTMLEILMQTARDLGPSGEDNESGWGLIDAEQAVLLAQAHHLVKANGTGEFPNIQAAINAASDGWVIDLADGIYTGAGNHDINFLGKAIIVRSVHGAESCVIQGTGTPPGKGFWFTSGYPLGDPIPRPV